MDFALKVYQDVSNSALLYAGNDYTMSIRLRSISGSSSSRITFTVGTSAASITAVHDSTVWSPFTIKNTLVGTGLTGRIDITQLNSSANQGALWYIDGLQVVEGAYAPPFIAHDRIRKTGQLYYPVEE